jgi:serine/threonine-protein kinase HipA
MFGASRVEPCLDLSRAEIIKEVRERALRMSLGGAQPKASVKIERGTLQVVSTGGTYLLKPSTEKHPFISENEHFCMNVVRLLKLPTAPFCLVTLRDGELAFLTKRFDRELKRKRHIEDFASVLGLPSDSKYTPSYLDILRASDQHCRDKGVERIRIFTLILASYVLGNNDLHLKNFSLIDQDSYYTLSPVYDVLCAKVYYPHTEDLALAIKPDYLGSLEHEGFYTRRDFLYLAKESGIHQKQASIVIQGILEKKSEIESLLTLSFLPQEMKVSIGKIIHEQFRKLSQG